MSEIQVHQRRVRALTLFFITALVLSGLTAVPLGRELDLLDRLAGPGTWLAGWLPALCGWIGIVHAGLRAAYAAFPQVAYGTDWLAFAHLVIAAGFIGLLRDPLRNRWLVEWGLLACGLLVVWAVLLGGVRGIPWFWTLIDCSFGILGSVPLFFARASLRRLEKLTQG